MTRIGITALFTAVLTSAGCATAFKAKTTQVAVTSATPGAAVLLDGKQAGVTPMTVEVSNKTDSVITVQANGREENCKMSSGASTGWIIADVLLTTGLGILVDWATHNWNNVTPNNCHVSV
jgi:hypothetical protein